MSRSRGPLYLTTLVVVASGACGGVVRTGVSRDETRDAAAAGGTGHIDPTPSAGGGSSIAGYPSGGYPNYGGSAGSLNHGGAGSGGADPAPYRCLGAPTRDPAGYGKQNDPCCKTSLGPAGWCVPESSLTIDPMRSAFAHDACGAGLKCAPTSLSPTDGGGWNLFASCSASLGAGLNIEGRCASRCFLAGHPRVTALQQDGCATDELCAPCFDPVDGTPTGACGERPGDYPRTSTPIQFPACGALDGGGPQGACIPRTIADKSGYLGVSNGLHQDDCPANDVCIPTVKAKDARACFAPCTTTLGALGPNYVAGACVPLFAVMEALDSSAVSVLEPDVCAAGEVCAPCADPLNNGLPSHVCD
jgi:hypothetical protein